MKKPRAPRKAVTPPPPTKTVRVGIPITPMGNGEISRLAQALLAEIVRRKTEGQMATPRNVALSAALETARQLLRVDGYDDDCDEG